MILSAVPKIITDLNDGHEMGTLIDLGAAAGNILLGFRIAAGVAGLGITGLPAACICLGLGYVGGSVIEWRQERAKKSWYGE